MQCSLRTEFYSRVFSYRGNFLVVSSTAAYTIGLTWGGITAPWDSARVLVPLVLGLVGLGIFIAYEATLATHPLVLVLVPRSGLYLTLVVLGSVLLNDKFNKQ